LFLVRTLHYSNMPIRGRVVSSSKVTNNYQCTVKVSARASCYRRKKSRSDFSTVPMYGISGNIHTGHIVANLETDVTLHRVPRFKNALMVPMYGYRTTDELWYRTMYNKFGPYLATVRRRTPDHRIKYALLYLCTVSPARLTPPVLISAVGSNMSPLYC
jgi:hypothetical protein